MRALLVIVLTTAAVSTACPPPSSNDGGGDPVDAGGALDAGVDAGPPPEGDEGGACLANNGCNLDTLVCLTEANGNVCRRRCEIPDAGDPGDPCGVGSVCFPLTNGTGGACLAGGRLDEACPCDDDFLCIAFADGTRCRPTCFLVDGGVGDCPAGAGTCAQLTGGVPGEGACVP
jgi:hypothetical protein